MVNNYGFKEGNTEKWYDKWKIFLQETTAVFTVKPEVNSELFQITNVVKWCQVGIFTKKNSDFNPKQYFPKPYRGFSFLNQTTLRPEEGRHMWLLHCKDQVVLGRIIYVFVGYTDNCPVQLLFMGLVWDFVELSDICS